MMYSEFRDLIKYEISYNFYKVVVEPKYMKAEENKVDFVKRYKRKELIKDLNAWGMANDSENVGLSEDLREAYAKENSHLTLINHLKLVIKDDEKAMLDLKDELMKVSVERDELLKKIKTAKELVKGLMSW